MTKGRKKIFTNKICMHCNKRKTYSRGLCSMCLRKDLYGECKNQCLMPANDKRGYCTNCITRGFEKTKIIGRLLNNDNEKWCNRCKNLLPIEEFYPQVSGSLKRAKYCKKCNKYSSILRIKALEYGINNVYQTSRNLCVKCFSELDNFDVDHIIPKSKGGTDEITNLQIMCKYCNRKKSDKESVDYRLPIDMSDTDVLKLIHQKRVRKLEDSNEKTQKA